MAKGLEQPEQPDAEAGAGETADEQDHAHLDVDVAARPVRDHS